MRYQLGRLVDHIHIRASDIEASRRFYRAVLAAVGLTPEADTERMITCDELYVSGDSPPVTTGLHLAFQAADRAMVDRFHADAIAAGGTDNGAPGIRTKYSAGYYGAFVLDPDGNNIEAVVHEGHHRSGESIEVWTDPEAEGR
jgi:catechol 2,3-dioxygenase-like lactoylglutathione lyase family enzyme